jgi:hypothetical protein
VSKQLLAVWQSTLHGPVHSMTQLAPSMQRTFELAPTRKSQLAPVQVRFVLGPTSNAHVESTAQSMLHELSHEPSQYAPVPHVQLALPVESNRQEPRTSHAQL